jgi:hypothetical protein
MDTLIRDLLGQIQVLEDDLRTALHDREARIEFTIRGKRVEFERGAREMHARLKRNGDAADFHSKLEAFRATSARLPDPAPPA